MLHHWKFSKGICVLELRGVDQDDQRVDGLERTAFGLDSPSIARGPTAQQSGIDFPDTCLVIVCRHL